MRLSLATHGGQAAAINMRLPPREVDVDALPPDTARDVRDLIAAVREESAGPTRSGPVRDAMSYTITVDDGERPATLTGSDTAMSPAFGELLSLIEQHAEPLSPR